MKDDEEKTIAIKRFDKKVKDQAKVIEEEKA